MRGSIKLMTIGGINLYMHWTLLMLAAWVGLVNAGMGNGILQFRIMHG